MRSGIWLCALVVLAASSTAHSHDDPIGEIMPLRPEADGGWLGDASDDCATPSPEVLSGRATYGHLNATNDPRDNFNLTVPADKVGVPHTVLLQGAPHSTFVVRVFGPDNGGNPCMELLGWGPANEELPFVPTHAGVHTLQVEVIPHEGVSLERASLEGVTRFSCHNMCATLENLIGYRVLFTAPVP